MNQNGQLVKRGVLTSRDMVESNFQINHTHQQGDIKREIISTNPNPTVPITNVIINKPPLTADQLNSTKYFNSLGIRDGRQEFSYNYQQAQIGTNSNFIPPPPSRFLMSSSHQAATSGSQHSLPIQSGHPQNLTVVSGPPGQPLFQSVHKTFIPHHIYNEIPIPMMNTETKYYQVEEQAGEEEINADERMLEEYDKLYQKYQEERESKVILQRKVEFLQTQLSKVDQENLHEHNQEITKTEKVYVNRPTRIDTKLLASILFKKIKPTTDEIFERRKAACINKLKTFINDQESVVRTPIIRSTQEIVRH